MLAALILVASLSLQDWQLATLILPVASLFFLSNLAGLPERVVVNLERRVEPTESFGEDNVRVELRLVNLSGSRLANVDAREELPNGLRPEKGAQFFSAVIDKGASVNAAYELPSPGRGHTKVGPLTVRSRDTLGLYMVENRLEEEIVAVLPRPEKVRGSELRPGHLGPWPGVIPFRTSGRGTEFYNIREYASGDDPKRINWKATARSGRLVVNEMESERVTDVVVVLDTDVAFYEAGERELFERGVRAAASVSSLLLRQGNRVGLVLHGMERGVVRPAFGKRQEKRILYMLAAARPGGSPLPTGYIVSLLTRLLLPSNAQVLLVSPLLDSDIVHGVTELGVDGYSVMVVSPTPGLAGKYQSESEKLAFKILMLERDNLILRLEKVCTLVQWPENVPLSAMLRRARVKRPRPILAR